MALNFADIASKKMEDVEKPPLPPVGTYRFRITKLPEATTSQSGEWDILSINCRAVEALDDVELEDYPGEITSILMQVRFMFNKSDEVEFAKSEYRARTFFENHVQCAEPGDTFGQALNKSVNGEFLGTIRWKPDSRTEGDFQAEIGRTAPVE